MEDATSPQSSSRENAGQVAFGLQLVGMQKPQSLAEDLHQYLLEEEICCASEDRLLSLGFLRCVDNAELPGHIYYEGYFHGLASAEVFESVHPRNGCDFDKPAAPLRLRAFCEALRRINDEALKAIAAAAPPGSLVQRLLETGMPFGDIAFQIHYGDCVCDKNLNWHVDASNSLLHMALGLRGDRTMYAKLRSATREEEARVLSNPGNKEGLADARFAEARSQIAEIEQLGSMKDVQGDTQIHSFPQRPGDAYVGNPISYIHSVEYPKVSWDDRIIAVQLRLVMTMMDIFDPAAEWGADQVALAIANQPLRMPTLFEVKDVVRELGSTM